MVAKLKYDPTMEPNTLDNTIEWCRQHNFQVGKRQGHLYIPEEYLANLTPLHMAAEDMHIQPEVIHQLMLTIPHTTRDANGDTPLLVALFWYYYQSLDQSMYEMPEETRLRCDNERTMASLLEEIKKPIHRSPSAAPGFSLDIDSNDAYGTTALYQACEKGNVDMVRLLLQEGANVNIASAANEMPLMATYVVGKGKLSRERRMILKMLVNHGADTTHQDSHGKPAVRTRLKARNYKDKEIKAMLSPDPMARFNMNLEHGRNSVSTVTTLSTSSSPVELAADIPTRLYELAIVDSIPRLTPGSDRSIPAHDARSNLQLAELEGPMPGGTVV
ncbi:unnamed protein product [Fusarium graminearum]|uniref:Uncharacterized protein n=1 Tax=Gibberella zeae (strain ATCC MYA-4620 / CBS 123657 / FGSC 9075 / NRRL 31084 / PH-1) TaxID=229533 RepID=A0A098DUY8_GIBZE|nr:unnamed protein product [Fusarium graminearum]